MPSASWIILAAVVAGNGLLDKVGHGVRLTQLIPYSLLDLEPKLQRGRIGHGPERDGARHQWSLVMPSLRTPGPGQAALEHDRSQPRAARDREDRATPRG
jgi:hypothetical protein